MEVRLQFAKDEEEEVQKGTPTLHDVTPSSFVAAGLNLEDQQCVFGFYFSNGILADW
jgi:hypothetical protein